MLHQMTLQVGGRGKSSTTKLAVVGILPLIHGYMILEPQFGRYRFATQLIGSSQTNSITCHGNWRAGHIVLPPGGCRTCLEHKHVSVSNRDTTRAVRLLKEHIQDTVQQLTCRNLITLLRLICWLRWINCSVFMSVCLSVCMYVCLSVCENYPLFCTHHNEIRTEIYHNGTYILIIAWTLGL